jgi:hypothetical protein
MHFVTVFMMDLSFSHYFLNSVIWRSLSLIIAVSWLVAPAFWMAWIVHDAATALLNASTFLSERDLKYYRKLIYELLLKAESSSDGFYETFFSCSYLSQRVFYMSFSI